MAAIKQQDLWNDELRISVPPPAYSHQPPLPLFSSPPPPCYNYSDPAVVKSNQNKEEEEDSWSIIMQRPFYHRCVFILHSWLQVLQQGKWVVCAFIFPLLLFIIILIVYVLPSSRS
ncbi:hypothetical protein BCR42DRAFT_416680 [Absidia repens]|uniref:Uncharacterized protein n=1 Tax=Absidia repens TaxID=90262 RepID=A0A1X2IEU5_9FUNG|nr:hypothetical protein BCR42DRAFT_416680 [Absidia repens]